MNNLFGLIRIFSICLICGLATLPVSANDVIFDEFDGTNSDPPDVATWSVTTQVAQDFVELDGAGRLVLYSRDPAPSFAAMKALDAHGVAPDPGVGEAYRLTFKDYQAPNSAAGHRKLGFRPTAGAEADGGKGILHLSSVAGSVIPNTFTLEVGNWDPDGFARWDTGISEDTQGDWVVEVYPDKALAYFNGVLVADTTTPHDRIQGSLPGGFGWGDIVPDTTHLAVYHESFSGAQASYESIRLETTPFFEPPPVPFPDLFDDFDGTAGDPPDPNNWIVTNDVVELDGTGNMVVDGSIAGGSPLTAGVHSLDSYGYLLDANDAVRATFVVDQVIGDPGHYNFGLRSVSSGPHRLNIDSVPLGGNSYVLRVGNGQTDTWMFWDTNISDNNSGTWKIDWYPDKVELYFDDVLEVDTSVDTPDEERISNSPVASGTLEWADVAPTQAMKPYAEDWGEGKYAFESVRWEDTPFFVAPPPPVPPFVPLFDHFDGAASISPDPAKWLVHTVTAGGGNPPSSILQDGDSHLMITTGEPAFSWAELKSTDDFGNCPPGPGEVYILTFEDYQAPGAGGHRKFGFRPTAGAQAGGGRGILHLNSVAGSTQVHGFTLDIGNWDPDGFARWDTGITEEDRGDWVIEWHPDKALAYFNGTLVADTTTPPDRVLGTLPPGWDFADIVPQTSEVAVYHESINGAIASYDSINLALGCTTFLNADFNLDCTVDKDDLLYMANLWLAHVEEITGVRPLCDNNPLIYAPEIAPITVDGNLADWADASDWAVFGKWFPAGAGLLSTTQAQYAWNDAADRLYIGIESTEGASLALELGGLMGNLTNPSEPNATPAGGIQATQIEFKEWAGGDPNMTSQSPGGVLTGVIAASTSGGGTITIEIETPIYRNWADDATRMNLTAAMDVYAYANVFDVFGDAGDHQNADGAFVDSFNGQTFDLGSLIRLVNSLPPTCSDVPAIYKAEPANLNDDCIINLFDFGADLSMQWMQDSFSP